VDIMSIPFPKIDLRVQLPAEVAEYYKAAVWQYFRVDKVVKPMVFDALTAAGFNPKPPSPLTLELPFVRSPTGLLLCLLGYFCVVLAGLAFWKAFPIPAHLKKTPDGIMMKLLMFFHNVFLTLLSLYMCVTILYEAYTHNYTLWGNAYDPSHKAMAEVIWVFYVSKIYEFMDTFIMILKGNTHQVSVLHVYHHGSISFIWWMITYHAPGGDAYFSAALNSWVHVCMYMYYLIASLLPKDEKTRKKYLWWGRYLTQMQMFQFFLNLLQAAYCWQFSPYPKFMSQLLLVYMVTLLGLFGNFYISKHHAAAKTKKKASKKSA